MLLLSNYMQVTQLIFKPTLSLQSGVHGTAAMAGLVTLT
jgi:hypothetical protein